MRNDARKQAIATAKHTWRQTSAAWNPALTRSVTEAQAEAQTPQPAELKVARTNMLTAANVQRLASSFVAFHDRVNSAFVSPGSSVGTIDATLTFLEQITGQPTTSGADSIQAPPQPGQASPPPSRAPPPPPSCQAPTPPCQAPSPPPPCRAPPPPDRASPSLPPFRARPSLPWGLPHPPPPYRATSPPFRAPLPAGTAQPNFSNSYPPETSISGTSYSPLPPGLRKFFVRGSDPRHRRTAALDNSAAVLTLEDIASLSCFSRWALLGVSTEERAEHDAVMRAAKAQWAALPTPPLCTAPSAYAAHRALTASRKRRRLR